MIALLFILIVTGLSILISYYLNPEMSWLAYYRGGVAGLFISAIAIYFWNKIKRDKELKIQEKEIRDRKKYT